MKEKFKPLLLITLLAVLTILTILPVKNHAVKKIYPGRLGPGEFGLTCYCPIFPYYDCGCQITREDP